MAVSNLNTDKRTYRQLLGNGLTYRIPPFQRDYSWGEQEWEDLWIDLLGTLPEDGEPGHYMGYLVLKTTDDRTFEVIDGQQRLTTLSLIVLAGMRIVKQLAPDGKMSEENRKRLDQLRASYIGYLDPVTLNTRNKLSLNRTNDSYYRDYLVTLADRPPQRGFPASTHTMRKGFEWFEKKLQDYVKQSIDVGVSIAQFIETMSDNLFFTVITVADELNAYKVFETLNARGVRLSATDLLKNYLFAVLARNQKSQEDIEDLDRRWEAMVGRLGSESFPDFLRMHWNSRESFARQTELFKVVRNRIQTRESVFQLLRDMDDDIDTYLALTQPEGSHWNQTTRQAARDLRMFSVRQPYPMLMAARRRLDDREFDSLIRSTVVLSFRYNVIGGQLPGEQERVYHSSALKIHRSNTILLKDILESLRTIYVKDDQFRSAFSDKSIRTTQSRNAKVVRYILCKLEKQASGKDFEIDSDKFSIEHVLPQSPQDGWDAFSDLDTDHFVYRLGNMVMLESGKNKELGNRPYDEKRPVYEQSSFSLTAQLAEDHAEWTPGRLETRQQSLAKLATAVWRIPQLS